MTSNNNIRHDDAKHDDARIDNARHGGVEHDDARQWAIIAARAADSKKATDIIVQQVRDILVITDYFVIATGANNRQIDAICEAIEESLRKEAGIKPIGREGVDQQTWVLLDYGDIVIHVFQPEIREYYRLESLWSDAPLVDLTQAGISQAEYSERIAKLISISDSRLASSSIINRTE